MSIFASWRRDSKPRLENGELVGALTGHWPARKNEANEKDLRAASQESIRAIQLVRAYRVIGHLAADLDPLKLTPRPSLAKLDPNFYGFRDSDLDRPIYMNGVLGLETATLRQMVGLLKRTYCGRIGYEFVHINDPVEKALAAGIPAVSYNADAKGNKRLCYIGQDLFLSGKALGQRIVEAVGEGDVAGFIATPGQLNIQPRMDGAREAIKESGKNIKLDEIATGPTVNEELSRIQAYFTGHPDIKGMFAVDAGSTEGVGKTMAANKLHEKGIHAGGFDLLPTTLDAISKGDLDFTIDQQPYLQGFYTIMVLFVYKISGGLSGLSEINTGLKFVTKGNVSPYLSTQSRFEGSASEEKVLTRSGPIS